MQLQIAESSKLTLTCTPLVRLLVTEGISIVNKNTLDYKYFFNSH